MEFERATLEFLPQAKSSWISMARVLMIGRQSMPIKAGQAREKPARHGKNLKPSEIDRLLTGVRWFCESFPQLIGACAKRTADKPLFAETPSQSDYSAIWEEAAGKTVGSGHTASAPKKWRRRLVPQEIVARTGRGSTKGSARWVLHE